MRILVPLHGSEIMILISADLCNIKINYLNQSINQYKLYSERNITENIKIFLQLYIHDHD